MTSLLAVRDVSKTFTIRTGRTQTSTRALAGVDLEVEDGEFVAIIGASGCGKSTLLRLIDGLDFPTSGEIQLRGRPITGPGPDRGVVFQQPNLLPWRTVSRNIQFALECIRVERNTRDAIVGEVLDLVGLGGFENHYPAQLSGGMQQRVGIARAYAVRPSMLLLDEPFGALDAQTRVVLQEDLERLWSAEQKTTILITHDMEEAVYLADRVVVMGSRPGRVVDIVDIPFDRPRDYDLRGTAEFGRLKTRLWHALQTGGPETGDAIVRHPSVSRIAFTGSHQVGRAIQRSGAEAGIKHVSLELGGKNALLLFEDADLDRALASAVKGMNFAFAGQSCGSTSRVLMHESLAAEFTDRYVRAVASLRLGLPWEEGVQMGPMVSRRQQERALGFISRAVDDGADLLTGGGRGPGDGYFAQPTVLGGVTEQHEVAREEVFGPVVSLMTFSEEEEAVRIANRVEYGLTGSVWTRDLDRAIRVSRALEAGYVWVNDTSTHFPGVPFGGVKLSGIGREESVDELLSYTQLRAINVVTA